MTEEPKVQTMTEEPKVQTMTEEPPSTDNAPPDLDKLMTVKEAAKFLLMCEKSLRAKAKAGKIPCVYFGGKLMRFHPRTLLKQFNPKDL